MVKELGLTPLTYTYDWGMVTDLARRNVARVCGKLGLENIIVSANIAEKRRNIHKNVAAWLRKPEIGAVPLFMAGDKQFYHYLNVLQQQTGLRFNVWMGNRLETTLFKIGYCGIKLGHNQKNLSHLTFKNKIDLAMFYLRTYIQNPGYINSSLADTIGAYISYYATPRRDYYLLYDYVKWEEDTIVDTLISEYEWEVSEDTESTWRIGDGTASFYNYIYYTVGGFSEIDTFRSNQIREGMLTREEALKKSQEENLPRYTSLKWYLDIIDIDYKKAIRAINSIPKRY